MWKLIKKIFGGKKKQERKGVTSPSVVKMLCLYPSTPPPTSPPMRPNTRIQPIEAVDVAQWLRNVREVDKLRKKMVQFA